MEINHYHIDVDLGRFKLVLIKFSSKSFAFNVER
jgi:hypothetical protein